MNKGITLLKIKALLLSMLLISVLGCSSEDSSSSSGSEGINIAEYYPRDISPTAKHESIVLQFHKVAGIGSTGDKKCFPSYDVKINTKDDVNSAVSLGSVPSSGSLLIRFYINKTKINDGNTVELEYKDLKDNQKYFIFLRSNYSKCGYGQSDWNSITATPVPFPTKAENIKVESGDKHLTISWTKKPGELYAVHVNDCPSKPPMYNKWTPKDPKDTDHLIIELDNNDTDYGNKNENKICIVTTNANGIMDGQGKSTWQVLGEDVLQNTTLKGTAATTAPAKPVIGKMEGKNRRAEFLFNPQVTGASSVSTYEYATSKDGYATWTKIIFNQKESKVIIPELENGKSYAVKIRAKNSATNSNGIESDAVNVTPKYTPIDYNNNEQFLGSASASFIYAENVPHSDFWRISESFPKGGRPDTDRLTRGKETALGNLFADGIMWYAANIAGVKNIDFSWLIGGMLSQGIEAGQAVTVGFLKSIITTDYLKDSLVVVEVLGSDLIESKDYTIDLNNYPAIGTDKKISLFSQAAAVYRNGHYGGSGGATFNGKYWGIPSKEVKYTIEYKKYSLDDFNTRFKDNCSTVNKKTGIDNSTGKLYDAVTDPKGCYILTYDEAYPQSGNPSANSSMGYKRGRVMQGSLKINNEDIIPGKTYKVLTTKKIAGEMYGAFLGKKTTDIKDKNGVNVTLLQAMGEYISGKGIISPSLDGRVKLSGGVPGDPKNDFQTKK